MISPSKPGMEGNEKTIHDGRPDASHEQEVNKAGGQSIAAEDRDEGSNESTPQEKRAEAAE